MNCHHGYHAKVIADGHVCVVPDPAATEVYVDVSYTCYYTGL